MLQTAFLIRPDPPAVVLFVIAINVKAMVVQAGTS